MANNIIFEVTGNKYMLIAHYYSIAYIEVGIVYGFAFSVPHLLLFLRFSIVKDFGVYFMTMTILS